MAALTAVTVIALEPLYAQYGTAPAGKAATTAKGKQDTVARREVGTPINDALKLVEAKDWDAAVAKVQQADAVKDKTPYEEYMVAKYFGYIAINREPQDLATAATAYNRQIASGGAPEAEQQAMYATAIRLNYAAQDYSKVIQNAADLQKFGPLDDTANEVLIQAYYNTMDYANAAKSAKEVNAAKTAAGEKPSAATLGLLLNSQAKLMDDAGYRVTLDQLATVSTQPEVWGQVMDFALAEATKGANQNEHHLLNLFRLGMLVGTMRDVDYSAMASIDLTNGLPNEAKEALTKGNRTGDLVTQANTMLANDQGSLAALAEEAGKETNGEIDVKLGESYLTYARYDEAVAAIRKGIEKGGLKDLPDAQTTLGIALYKAGKKDEALAEFRNAEMANTPARIIAHTWVLFLQRPAA
jgi:hypothetical protein